MVTADEDRTMRALGRTLRMWSLITLWPVARLLPLQKPLLKLFNDHPNCTEDELLKLGLKYLHSAHPGKKSAFPTPDAVKVLMSSLRIQTIVDDDRWARPARVEKKQRKRRKSPNNPPSTD